MSSANQIELFEKNTQTSQGKHAGEYIADIDRPHERCAICSLAARNPNVVLVVHELYRRGQVGAQLRERLAQVFAEASEELPPPSTFARHFDQHTVLRRTPNAGPSQTDYETDYFELRELYHDFRRIFSDIREGFAHAHAHGEGTSDLGLTTLVKLASELRHMLKVLSDMRNSEKLVSVILERHTAQLIGLLTEPLGITLREIRDALRAGESPQVVADRVQALLSGELYPTIEAAAQHALDQSKQNYKLH